MKKHGLPHVFVSIVALTLALISFFFPFLSIKYYENTSGFKLLFCLFQRFPIKATSSDAFEVISLYSYSMPLLISLLCTIATIVFLIFYIKSSNNVKWLNFSLYSVIVATITLGMQLSNSNTMVSDFFGALSQITGTVKGKTFYQVADVEGISIGFGARMFTALLLIALIALVWAKIVERESVDRSEHLQTPLTLAYKQFKKNKLALLGTFIIAVIIVICFFGPVFSNFAMLQTNIMAGEQAPNLVNLFGTDSDGRDVLTRILYGGRISIEIGFVVVIVEVIIGTIIGGIAGFYGGWIDNLLMRIDDIFLSLPFWPIMLIICAVMMDMQIDPSKRIYFIMLILGLLFWPSLARLVRGQILSLREQEYIVAAEALGIRDRKRIFKHLVPNALPNIIVTATLDVGNAILTESALSFLGLGVAIPYPSWGNIIDAVNDPNDFVLRPWLWIPAGICILLTVLAINFVGDGLRDAFDPKMKR